MFAEKENNLYNLYCFEFFLVCFVSNGILEAI